MRDKIIIIVHILLLIGSFPAYSQTDSIELMRPTGSYPIGTMTYEWTDQTREIQYSSHKGDKRTVVVQIWYPAKIKSNSVKAPYAPISNDYQKIVTHSFLRPSFSDSVKTSPLLLFSPGRGMERYLYSTLIEDLVSHGFMIASIDMPGIGYTIYQDGLIIKPSEKYKPPKGMMGGPYEKVDEFFNEPSKIGYTDLEFVLDKISELNQTDLNERFTNRIKLDQIGIFGHSLGGRIAGEFAARNGEVKAYISMEGIPPREVRYKGEIKIPMAMLCSSGTLPYAIENYNSMIENRTNTVYMIELIGFGHNSVTDLPIINPNLYSYDIDGVKGLKILRELVTGYFKSVLINGDSYSNKIKQLENVEFIEYK
jgi:pimeloyl-ACP methyl ester carboxylesterase